MILALDLSSKVGWAVGREGKLSAQGTLFLPSPITWGDPLIALIDWLADTVTVFDPKECWVEAPLPAQAQTNARTARMQLFLTAAVHIVCCRRELPVMEAHASTVRAAVVGSGRAKKDAVMEWCRAQGHPYHDHNAADAIALWAYACRQPKRRAA